MDLLLALSVQSYCEWLLWFYEAFPWLKGGWGGRAPLRPAPVR